ncbi:hypothetical protein BpHYR1_047155 [Brachionus plicatilis]|uniref:Uncharacterized protein n=1 Tax=Brachionus plicatilis TaxID=10195 RepID=A0A3M7QC51_BRAPC|nr:hypothetical protein BpHYR1_047155 [Brachionus plicatilis]
MTNQPQFRQFQLMSNSSSQNSQNGQVVIQQPNIVMNSNTGQPQTTIRKVGSSTNISTLQQKVQVINRGNIQIVQANSGQRLTKTTPLNTTSVSSSTSNSTPIQFQQAFQQQTAKQPAPNSNQTTSVSTLTSGATMPTLKTSTTPAQKSSSTPTTVKTLLASSSQAPNFSIISTSAGVNTSGIPQAIPINSSLSQVLRQLGNQNNLSINIQSLNSINASPIQLIQATSSNSGTNVSDSNENSNNSEPTLVVGSNNNSNLTSSQNENKQ